MGYQRKRDRRRRAGREKLSDRRRPKALPEDSALDRLCTCGHPYGSHYAKGGWPACGDCLDCQEFNEDKTRDAS